MPTIKGRRIGHFKFKMKNFIQISVLFFLIVIKNFINRNK